MDSRNTQRFVICLALFVASIAFAATPSNLSLKGIVDWAEVGGHIASGTGSLPAVASAGARYTDLSVATAPVEYRSNGASWVPISSSGGGSGVATHSLLANLDFSSSGHTGFASSGAVITNHSGLSNLDFSGSGHTGFASIGAIITDHSALNNKDFASSGHTGFASSTALSATDATLSAHLSDQTDPHGATESLSLGLTLGTGTADAFLDRIATGTLQVATWARVIPSVASPTNPATGTIWQDASGVYRVYDGNGSWSSVLTDYPVWQDLRVSLLSTNAGGTNAPSPVMVRQNGSSQGVFAFQFSATVEQELYTSVQLPHDCYKTIVSPHLHWISPNTNVATFVWGIEYAIANYNAAYPAATTIATAAAETDGTAYKHMITEFPAINISSAKDSAVLLFRVYRDATNASDTGAATWGTDFDLHYQVKNRGSSALYGDN